MSNFISKAGVLQKFLGDVSYEEEVVMYASALDEGTLARRDKCVHEWHETKYFRYDFCGCIDQVN
jgi:hypothetical protein